MQLTVPILALALTSTAAAQATCGTLQMEGGWTATIYRDACYNIAGKALSAQVSASCDCDFSKWENCDAGKMRGRDVTGVPVNQAKAYWCFKH
ncbi:hypothetical protein IQ07DRAFT_648146 [Pyrenochaeta sp. DS3sAY3a]|nr:hypothetical protein IQ07DRAFT_648146 [Pyrenochaeta sp. DS3sAY3a]